MIRKALLALAALAVLALGGLYALGLSIPATTRTEREVQFAASPEQVHARISDVRGQKAWRSDIGKVEVSGDGKQWTEFPDDGSTLAFRLIESRPASTFVIAYKSSLGFEGNWRAGLEPDGNGTRGVFAEKVTIPNPFLRAIGRVTSPPGQHLDLYLQDLRRVTEPQ
ncbi:MULTISPECIES: SRPBCC family protein [Sphingomonadales]|jgi:hypothetical protein|uniref:SRPBCC family protein n=1 Tax=Sphingomonadales TaxID=204457 RepID=UPI0008261CAC|nr:MULTISPECIES: SRPBCC family protein [Sphingomonadales]